jgi:hypothetical protein
LSYRYSAFKNKRRWSGHQDRFVFTRPAYHKITATEFNGDRFIQEILYPTDYDRRTGAGAAGQRFTGPPFEHAQPNAVAVHNLHKADIDVHGKARMRLNRWPESRDRR